MEELETTQTDLELVEELRTLKANSVSREEHDAEIKKLREEKKKLARLAIDNGSPAKDENENNESLETLALRLYHGNSNNMSNLELIETVVKLHDQYGYKYSDNKYEDSRVAEEFAMILAESQKDPRKATMMLQEIPVPVWFQNRNHNE